MSGIVVAAGFAVSHQLLNGIDDRADWLITMLQDEVRNVAATPPFSAAVGAVHETADILPAARQYNRWFDDFTCGDEGFEQLFDEKGISFGQAGDRLKKICIQRTGEPGNGADHLPNLVDAQWRQHQLLGKSFTTQVSKEGR